MKKTLLFSLVILSILITKAQTKTTHQTWKNNYLETSSIPASKEVLAEYYSLVNKCFVKSKTNTKIQTNCAQNSTDENRLKELFCQMDVTQQCEAPIVFYKPLNSPFKKDVPSLELFENLKNSAMYGVWINNQKVSNSTLNKYKNTDFSHLVISKLSGVALVGKSYKYQVDLMTNEYFKEYCIKTINNKESHIGIKKSYFENGK